MDTSEWSVRGGSGKLNKLARRAASYAKSIEMPAYPVDLGICNNLKLNGAEE